MLATLLAIAMTKAESTPGAPAPTMEIACPYNDAPITLDGMGDEPLWQRAALVDFALTCVRFFWDREHLYFFADMMDDDLIGDDTDGDALELYLKPAADKPGYYGFRMTATGAIHHMFVRRRDGVKPTFKREHFLVQAKVHLNGTLNQAGDRDTGWSVEGRIPWCDLLPTGGRPNPGETWRLAVVRRNASAGVKVAHVSSNVSLKDNNVHDTTAYAPLRFAGPDAAVADRPYGIARRVPLTTSRVVGSPDPPKPYRAVKAYPELKVNYPMAVVHQPHSDRLWFITQDRPYSATAIRRMKSDGTDEETMLASEDTAYDICFHPDFLMNGFVYIGSNGPQSGKGKDRKTRVTRYQMDPRPPYPFDPKSAFVIIDVHSDGHNGGAVCFGHDGMMYVTTGDGTSDSDTNIVGQDMTTLLAKVLRIDVDHPDPGKHYSVPKDNPFVNLAGARPEIWAYGLRNPWRMTVDKRTGHIWVGQNGQDLWEQAFLVKKGDNYGWSVMEGSHPFYPNRKPGPTPFVKPTIEHPHSEFRSLTGGIVYYGTKFPELAGAYIYGDYSTGQIWAMRHDGVKVLWHKQLADTRLQITGFGADAKGELLICDHRGDGKGGFYTLQPTPKDDRPSTFPTKLSDSGLFQSVKGHVMQPGPIHYSVIAQLWGDNAFKERWIALPPDGHIDVNTTRGWNFPDGTVIVKSFGLEMEPGNPDARRWIETRFLTNQKGEWFGYSYAWNEEQTEGFLVEAQGRDRDVMVRVPHSREFPDGRRKQTWHYPSRTECMVCHSRAANWVLGLTELQMNKTHDYGKVSDNQLRTLEMLGVLKVNYAEEITKRMREDCLAKGVSEKDTNEYVNRRRPESGQRQPPATSSLLTVAPDRHRRLVDPYDPKADLTLRARSYLHSNCAQCHVEAGGGNAQIDLEFTTPLDKMRLIDVAPQHHTFGLKDARLVARGHPERSVLLHRMAHRGDGKMPPLATSLVDEPAVEMLREWIRSLPSK